jgi:hypothetical protein
MALCRIFEGKFIKAGIWLCFSIFALNIIGVLFLDEPWSDFTSLYIFIMGLAVGGSLLRLWLKKRSEWKQGAIQTELAVATNSNVFPFIKATREEREKAMKSQDYKCGNPYCNTDLRHSVPHWDHIIPRSKGGNDGIHNMQWLCDTCNLNKKDKDWPEFLYYYAMNLGIDPQVNDKPWKTWVLNRARNGL